MGLVAREAGTQAIDRAAQILKHLVETDDFMTLNGVVEETRLPKSTAARLLRALERNGLAQRGASGGFRPGPVLVEYARRDASTADLGVLARPFLERLGAETGETTNIAIPTPAGVARLAEIPSSHPKGAGTWVGARIPAHASSLGKVFMAYGAAQPPFGRLARLAPNTIVSMTALLEELELVRTRGYATTWEELEAGLCSVAAPVRGKAGGVIAAVSVSAPTVRLTRDDLPRLAPLVQATAAALSAHIGYRPTDDGGDEQ